MIGSIFLIPNKQKKSEKSTFNSIQSKGFQNSTGTIAYIVSNSS